MTWRQLRGFTEAAPTTIAAHPPVERKGFDPDIPEGGTTETQQSAYSAISRRQDLDDLYNLYMTCAPASAAIDSIARTITAGGLDIVPETETKEEIPKKVQAAPPNVQAVRDLIAYVNPNDDIRQLLRNAIVDLEATGDAFIEVTWSMGVPVALWNLDAATTTPLANEHGTVTGFVQQLDSTRKALFTPNEVIHIKLDAPRGGVFGTAPTRKLVPVLLAWIWTASLLKETMRKGNPPRLHLDFPVSEDAGNIRRFRQQYPARHLGPANLGVPLTTKGGAKATELQTSKIAELLATLSDLRDIILSGYGVPGRKVGVAEQGSLGGAGVEAGQDHTFDRNTCFPIGALVLEKLQFVLLNAWGIKDWKLQYGKIDEDDSPTLEQLYDLRLRSGAWTINRYRAEIGEPGIGPAGDIPILVVQRNLMAWPDVPAFSKANLANASAPPEPEEPEEPDQSAKPGAPAPAAKPGVPGVKPQAAPKESTEALIAEFTARQFEAMRALREARHDAA